MTKNLNGEENPTEILSENTAETFLLEAAAVRLGMLAVVDLGVRSTSPFRGIYERGAIAGARMALAEQAKGQPSD